MRDPTTSVEMAIEEARCLLKGHMKSKSWKGDPDRMAFAMRETVRLVEESDMPDYAKRRATLALSEQAKKRPRKKRTLHYRDMAIQLVAARLRALGYASTRNDATKDHDFASSIICKALRLLDDKLSEKAVNAILGKSGKWDVVLGKDGDELVSPASAGEGILIHGSNRRAEKVAD